jgi:hypothetical protein
MHMKNGLALLLIGAVETRMQTMALDMEASLTRAIVNTTYQQPAQVELTQAQELFKHTLQGDRTAGDLRSGWARLGFAFHELTAEGEPLWLVCETPGNEGGRGWYLFRTKHQSNLALEAPHARNDVHTGLIGLRLFQAGTARALAASTITRYRADMAHLDNTYFQAFTRAFAEACPTGLVVQFHGFESGNHKNVGADILASAGTRSPQPWFEEVVDGLKQATAMRVLAFPRDTKILGAMLNAQGKELNRTGHCRFLHLEMTPALRERLARDPELRRAILESLSGIQSK